VVRAFASLGTKKVRLTGGEPTLRKDIIDVTGAVAATPGIELVAMTSHGGRLKKLAKPLRKAGLHQVNISIDSLDPRQFHDITGQNKLAEVLQGLDEALNQGLLVKVNAVLMSTTTQQSIDQFLTWLKTTPVTLRFIELMETGQLTQFFQSQKQRATTIREKLINEGWQAVRREIHAGPAEEFLHPDYAGRIGLITPYAKGFCDTCNRLRMSALGKLHLCLFSEHGIDMRADIASLNVERVKKQLQVFIGKKAASHFLHEGNTGATKHLAMLGG
jgi:cyclic pyranopterin phosphate synthase